MKNLAEGIFEKKSIENSKLIFYERTIKLSNDVIFFIFLIILKSRTGETSSKQVDQLLKLNKKPHIRPHIRQVSHSIEMLLNTSINIFQINNNV